MPFGLWARIGPGNHVLGLHGGLDLPWEGVIIRGKGAVRCKVKGHFAVSCAKMAEPIDLLFGL